MGLTKRYASTIIYREMIKKRLILKEINEKIKKKIDVERNK